jgi:hypothetical protein
MAECGGGFAYALARASEKVVFGIHRGQVVRNRGTFTTIDRFL